MPRNFFRRIEVLFPIDDPALRRWVTNELFPIEMQDNENSRILHSNGAYLLPPRGPDEPAFSAQSYFMASAAERTKLAL